MVTLCELGIEITFFRSELRVPVEQMYESYYELDKKSGQPLSFREYERIEVLFQAKDPNVRLYLEGLDRFDQTNFELDLDGEAYLKPSNCKYPLFSHDKEYYNIRVGTYEIKLVTHQDTYIHLFAMEPKHLSKYMFHTMNEELERAIQGLTYDFLKRYPKRNQEQEGRTTCFETIIQISDQIQMLMASLHDLMLSPSYRIRKIYVYASSETGVVLDQHATAQWLKKGLQQNKCLNPKKIYDYDIPQNQFLLQILYYVRDKVKDALTLLESNLHRIENQIERLKQYDNGSQIRNKVRVKENFTKYKESMLFLSHAINRMLNQPWIKEVSGTSELRLSHTTCFDPRYAVWFRFYETLKECEEYGKKKSFQFVNKVSSQLYEMWCYLKICSFLCMEEINFTPITNLEQQLYLDSMQVDLLSGTSLEFQRGRLRIRVSFDAKIPDSSKHTQKLTRPLFTIGKHRRPDIRLDFYEDEKYLSSIVMDAKYRTLQSIWLREEANSKAQLQSYKYEISSPYCYDLHPQISIRKIRPVEYVWVLYPCESETEIYSEEGGFVFVPFNPAMDFKEIRMQLKKQIEDVFGMDCI